MTSAYISAMPSEPGGSGIGFPIGVDSSATGLPFMGNSEPALADVMADDVIRRVMARDGVRADQLLSLIDQVRTRLR
ncbi:MAG: hypothetical protein M0006_11810 [Magnetospirillum sp.]|nr:hypothetical protein [Magnetospirillum sp.]